MKNVKDIFCKHRRGVVDVQFNWIFIMIAGFVIFLFIISIVMSQKKNADTQAGVTAINQINTILKGKQQAANVYSEISLPRTDIEFRCDPDIGYFTFRIADSDRIQLPLEILFAPQQLNSNKVQIWSQAFELPFPVTVFTYITSSDRAILIYNSTGSSDARLLYDSLPNNITKHYISNINQYNTFKNRQIICLQGDCPIGPNIDYLKIIPASGHELFDYGNVTFYKKSVAQPTSMYITSASLFGAIFSDDVNYYNCQMHRVLKQFEVKRLLVDARLELLATDLQPGACQDSVNITRLDVESLKDSVLEWSNITNMYNGAGTLRIRNTDLTLSSCPKIY